MTTSTVVDWPKLIDEVLLANVIDYSTGHPGDVDTVFLTGSYVRGSYNPVRPNVNVYVVAVPGRAPQVRADLADVLDRTRHDLRRDEVDLTVDCHPYTISQRDPAWENRPLLTLTTKVLAGEHADDRYHISPTIGLGWYAAHRVLVGRPEVLDTFAEPPVRDRLWLAGAHQALSHYRNVLDHLPWALPGPENAARLLEESCRYAEEALRDGVHIGLTDDELAAGRNIEILHDWAETGRTFYRRGYGPDGVLACETVDRLKAWVRDGRDDPATAREAWMDAIRVWNVVWSGYYALAVREHAGPELLRVTSWL